MLNNDMNNMIYIKISMKDIDILITTIVLLCILPENIRLIYKSAVKEYLRILISGMNS